MFPHYFHNVCCNVNLNLHWIEYNQYKTFNLLLWQMKEFVSVFIQLYNIKSGIIVKLTSVETVTEHIHIFTWDILNANSQWFFVQLFKNYVQFSFKRLPQSTLLRN